MHREKQECELSAAPLLGHSPLLLIEEHVAEKICWLIFFFKGQGKNMPTVHVLLKAAVETSQRRSVHFLFLVQRIYMLFLMIWAFSSG